MSPWKWTGLVDLLPFWLWPTLLLVAKAANLGVIPDSSLFFTAHGISSPWHIHQQILTAPVKRVLNLTTSTFRYTSAVWLSFLTSYLISLPLLLSIPSSPLLPHPPAAKSTVILYTIDNDPCNKGKQRKKTHNQTDHTFPLLTPLLWQFSVTLRTPFKLSRSWPTGSISHGNIPGHTLTLCPTFPLQPHSLVLFHELRQTIPISRPFALVDLQACNIIPPVLTWPTPFHHSGSFLTTCLK